MRRKWQNVKMQKTTSFRHMREQLYANGLDEEIGNMQANRKRQQVMINRGIKKEKKI